MCAMNAVVQFGVSVGCMHCRPNPFKSIVTLAALKLYVLGHPFACIVHAAQQAKGSSAVPNA